MFRLKFPLTAATLTSTLKFSGRTDIRSLRIQRSGKSWCPVFGYAGAVQGSFIFTS
jgi:hypothetical protein